MKTFQQYINEVYDRSFDTATRQQGEGGRVRASRKKSEAEKKRTKVVDGKRVPVNYKDRKDIGTQRPRSQREQQPTRERGSAALSAKEAQRKAYKERKAREAGAKTKTADQLLTTKKKSDYVPRKKSGLTTKQRKALYKKGERTLRDIRLQNLGKKSEKELKHKITSK